jgi:site-specific DNA-methyltransferase (adenine-specific)
MAAPKVHSAALRMPAMSEDEFTALCVDIQENGQLVPIELYKGQIIDGRHRQKACEKLGIEPEYIETDLEGLTPEAYVLALNLKRRHLTPSQIAAFAVDDGGPLEAERAAAKERQGERKDLRQQIALGSQDENKAADRVAKATGTNREYVRQAERIKEAAPEVFEQVKAGTKTIGEAKKELARAKRLEEKRSKLAAAPAASSPASASDSPQTWKIVHGDCVQCLSNLIPGSVQLVFADPPYNIGVDYGGSSKADQLSEQQFVDWAASWIEPAIAALADDGSIWVMINDEYAAEFCLILKRCGLHMRNWIKWYETFGVNCASKFNRCSRHILYFTKSAKKFVFNTDAVSRPSDRQVIYKDRRADHHGKLWDDVWWIPRLTGTSAERLPDFPTQLPLELVRAIVQCASDPGDLVVDPFCGSGTTGVACIESGRQFVGIEREVKWYEMATRRLASTTHARAAR